MYLVFCFCPQTHIIIADDYSYADQVSGIPQPFGKGGDCRSGLKYCHSGKMTVNFTGTGFTIHREVGLARYERSGQKSGFNSLRPRLNRRHFAVDVSKCNFLNESAWIPIKISLKFVPEGPINNIPALVQIMAWRRTGNKSLFEAMMTQFNDAYIHHSASMS